MIWIPNSDIADFMMRADGSEAKMCGYGIGCVGKSVMTKVIQIKRI